MATRLTTSSDTKAISILMRCYMRVQDLRAHEILLHACAHLHDMERLNALRSTTKKSLDTMQGKALS